MDDRVLVVGASGMLGSTLIRHLPKYGWETWGTVRGQGHGKLIGGVDAYQLASVKAAIQEVRPVAVVNCVGVIRQRPEGQEPLPCISLNALFPHQLSEIAAEVGARVVHVSTDCVFSGKKQGLYNETDFADASDIYGRTKFLGELHSGDTITLRTSIIGHEFRAKLSLVEWFLSQSGKVRGYTKAIYSGMPTVELARVIGEFVLTRKDLKGLYQVSADPISKFELLKILATVYGKQVELEPFAGIEENKALDSSRFRQATSWSPPSWDRMIAQMFSDFQEMTNARQ